MSTLRGIRKLAAVDNETNLSKYLEYHFVDMYHFLNFLLENHLEQWQDAKIRDLVDIYKKIVTLPKAPENMARYQSSLDNELYKAIRALRDAQAWRAERRLNIATTVSDTKFD